MDGVSAEAGKTGEAPKLRVFLSYSRKDAEFTGRLAEALTARGYLVDFDRSAHDKDNVTTGISAEDEWWKRLQEMIEAADAMVFVVSPDSAGSKVCDEEIAYARSLGKRVIAILRSQIDFAAAPPRLAALNMKLSFVDDAAFEASVAELSAALDRDVAWLREQTRLIQAAADWEKTGRREEELLRGAEISEAEAWSARRPPSAPEVPELVLGFLAESRKAQGAREEKERRSLKRQRGLQRWVGGLTAAALAVTLAGGWFVMQGQRELARRTSAAFAIEAAEAFDAGEHDRAIRLAMIAVRDTWLSPAAGEAQFELRRASAASQLVMRFPEVDGSGCLDVSADGRLVVATEGYGAANLNPLSGKPRKAVLLSQGEDGAWSETPVPSGENGANCAVFARGGDTVIVEQFDGRIGVARWAGGEWTNEVLDIGAGVPLTSPQMLPDGRIVAAVGGTAVILTPDNDGWAYEILTPQTAIGGRWLFLPSTGLHVSDDGRTIAREIGGAVRLWSQKADGIWDVRRIVFDIDRGGAAAAAVTDNGEPAPEQDAHHHEAMLSRDGRRLLMTDEEMAELWEQTAPGQWKRVDRLPPDDGDLFGNGTLSPTGDVFVVAGAGSGVDVMRESKAGDFTLERLEEAGLRSGPALFSGDGSRFALPHADGLLIWNAAETATTPRLLTTSGYLGKFSQDGAVLATAGISPASKGVEIWRPDANRLAGGQALDLEGDLMKTAGFLEDGRVFQATLDGAVRVWRRDGGKWTPGPAVASTDDYRDFAEGAGLTLAIASDDRLIIAREGKDGWTKDELPAERIRRGAVSPDGAAIVTRGAGDRLQLWTQQDGKWVAETLADSGATDAAVAGGGDRVVSIEREGDGAVVVLRTRSKAGAWARQILGGQLPSGIGRIDISRDGRRIAAGGPGGDIWLWSLTRAEDWAEERIVIPSNSVRLSPDGSALATTHEDGWVRVWTVREDGKWVGTPVGDPDDRAQDARFSPDGQMLVVRRAGEGMRLIDIAWLGLAGAEGRGDLELLSAEVCASKLPPSAGSNLRRISAEDVAAAPMLAGREGEDVCAWRPAWYDRVLDFLFGWTG